MPMMSSTTTASPSPQKTEIKPIGFLTANSNHEIPTVVTSTVANISTNARNTANAVNSNSYYPNTTVSTPGQFQMGPLSVMVAKFTSNPSISSNRQQTVILQPRINTTRATTLQMNPIRGPAIISQTNPNPMTPTTQSISVRTRVLSGQAHQNNTMPVLNLSTVTNTVTSANSSTSNTVKQVIKGQKFLTTTSNLETVNLVMTTPNDRNIRTNSVNNELKANTMLTVQHINNIKGPKSVLPSSTIVAQPKMISINNTGSTNMLNCQRLGIIGTSVGGNKQGIINLTTNLPTKSFIFTSPNATLTGTGATIANMVSISSANLVQPGQATKINVTPNHINIAATTRHPVTSTNALTQNNLLSPKATIYTVATTSANVFNSVSSLPTTTISNVQQTVSYSQSIPTTTVTISTTAISTTSFVNAKPTILTTNLSPVKPLLQTPNSPRPRILSRKRLQSDSTTITMKTANGSICNSSINMVEPKPQPTLSNCVENQLTNIVIKTENLSSSTLVPNLAPDTNLTPRKKPRKQLLEPSSPKKEIDDEPQIKEIEKDEVKEQKTILRKPRPLLYLYNPKDSPKSQQHFIRHTDVKQKQEKKVSITDLLSDVQKKNVAWKVNHIAEQLKKSSDEEICTLQCRLENFLKVLENDISPFSSCASNSTLFGDSSAEKVDIVDKICVKLNDLTRANIQRTKLILDHYNDSKQLLHKLTTDHKERVTSLAKRIGHKRGYIK